MDVKMANIAYQTIKKAELFVPKRRIPEGQEYLVGY